MSDRIIIDHIYNTINIQANTVDLSQMNDDDILKWVKQFISSLENCNIAKCPAGDFNKKSSTSVNQDEFQLIIIDEYI